MKLWIRAAGALKDRNSLLAASLMKRTTLRNPDLEAALIKATSHNESFIDYKNATRVFKWIRTAPGNDKPLLFALTRRIQKTRNWAVALKGLLLMHGVFCLKIPLVVFGMTGLPFDLASFTDRRSNSSDVWGYNVFVRSYFAFLDAKFHILKEQNKIRNNEAETDSMVYELSMIQKWQSLMDILLQIKPVSDNMKRLLVREAMDCVIIEIFEVYSRICNDIANVLMKICTVGKIEAALLLQIIQKTSTQEHDLYDYFEFCKEFGVLNASELPKVKQIPEEDIRDLERIIKEAKRELDVGFVDENVNDKTKNMIVVYEKPKRNEEINDLILKTVVTDKWVVFDEDKRDYFATSLQLLPLVDIEVDQPIVYKYEIPDLISF